MILEKFFTNEYDNDEIFVEKNVKFSEFKDYVFYQKNEFEKSQIADVVLLCENYFDFAVNFFAAIFAKKNIYLLTDKSRLNLLDFSCIKPENFDKKMSWKNFKNDYNSKEIMINFFTSGSSGIPKLIGKTLYNLEVEAQSVLDEFNLKKDSLVVSTTLSSHSYGIAFNFILPFYSGMKIFQTRIEFPEQLPKSSNYIFISTPSFVEKFEKYDEILKYIKEDSYVYFVHSYYANSSNKELVAYAEYEKKIPSIVRKDNVYGLQFHPEKSGEVGQNILKAYKELILK